MIKRATKKPVKIDYVEWTGDNVDEVVSFIDRITFHQGGEYFCFSSQGFSLMIGVGDMIIKDQDGILSKCKPDIFAKTYTIDKGE